MANLKIDEFFKSLEGAENAILYLDYDGTLAPFQINPLEAVPYPGVSERLHRIILGNRTKVIIISGRSLYELLPLIPLAPLPDLWGSHGGERLTPQQCYTHSNLSDKQDEGLKLGIETCLRNLEKDRWEQKLLSVAVHWRGLEKSKQAEIRDTMLLEWTEIAKTDEMEVHEFDGGLELRPSGINKGVVIATTLKELHHNLPMPIAYLGDDNSDEEAFATLGDRALKVLVKREPRPTRADVRIVPPEELLAFFDRWIQMGPAG